MPLVAINVYFKYKDEETKTCATISMNNVLIPENATLSHCSLVDARPTRY